MARLELQRGDITAQADVDAIVNAANEQLAPGAGVCGAIRRAGGAAIFEEAARLGGCATGDAKATGAGDLPNRFVVHAVGPVYSGRDRDAELLASCHRRAIEEAAGARLPVDRVPRHLDRHLRLPDRRGGAIAVDVGAAAATACDARPGALRAVLRVGPGGVRDRRARYLTPPAKPVTTPASATR